MCWSVTVSSLQGSNGIGQFHLRPNCIRSYIYVTLYYCFRGISVSSSIEFKDLVRLHNILFDYAQQLQYVNVHSHLHKEFMIILQNIEYSMWMFIQFYPCQSLSLSFKEFPHVFIHPVYYKY